MMVLKNTIKECRSELHINQQQLAENVGTTRETIGRLETGKYQNPTYRLVYEVATFFGKPVEDIFRYEDDEPECL